MSRLGYHVRHTQNVHGIADTAQLIVEGDARLTNARTPTAHASSHNAGGADALAIDAAAATGSLRTLGTSSTAACAGNDSRLSDARTPTAHKTSHQSGGSDAIKLDDLAAPDDNTDLNASTSAHGLMQKYPGGTTNFLRADGSFAAPTASAAWGSITGTLSDQADLQSALDAKAASSHTHGVGDIASLGAGVLAGRTNASGGSGQEITPTTGIEMSGTSLRNKDQMNVLLATLDQDVTNAQNTASTYFTFSVTAGKRYIVDLEMAISGNDTTGDFEWRFAVAAGTMNGGGTTQSLSTALAVQNVAVTASAAASTANLSVGVSANLEAPVAVRALFAFVPSNTTTFMLQFGNNSAAAGRTSRIMQGSIMRYKQMN